MLVELTEREMEILQAALEVRGGSLLSTQASYSEDDPQYSQCSELVTETLRLAVRLHAIKEEQK